MHVGSVFNSGVPSESEKFARTTSRLHSSVPAAIHNFNDALDVLEGDLVSPLGSLQAHFAKTTQIRTRAVLARDLRLLHVAESKRASTDTDASVKVSQADTIGTGSNEQMNGLTDNDSSPDITMLDAPSASSIKDSNGRESQAPKLAESDSLSTIKASASQQATKAEVARATNSAATKDPNALPAARPATADVDGTKKQDRVSSASQAVSQPPSVPSHQDTVPQQAPSEEAVKDEQAEPSPGEDFSSLLPGLDMYANDPNGDAMGNIDHFNDINNNDSFDMVNSNEVNVDPFGPGDDLNADLNPFTGDFNIEDMISFDPNNTTGETNQSSGGPGGLAEFDDDFFNMSG